MKLSDFIKKYGDCEVTEEMEKCIKKNKGKWMPEIGEYYYYLNDAGYATSNTWANTLTDNYRRDFLHIFRTNDEAFRYVEIMKACKEASFEPDWNDHNQGKHYFKWMHGHSKLDIGTLYTISECQPFYFKYKETAERLIYTFGEKDIAKYVLGVEIEE